MSETFTIERPVRPTWNPPPPVSIALVLIGIVLGLLGVILDIPRSFQPWVRGASWLVFLGSSGVVLLWILHRCKQEGELVAYKIRNFDSLYQDHLADLEKLDAQHGRIRYLSKLVMQTALAQEEVAIYELTDSVLANNEVLVTVSELDNRPLDPGDILIVMDHLDGMWLADLEVTNRKTVMNQRLIKLTSWDAMFLTSMRTSAEGREPVKTRAKAYRFPSDTGQE